MKVYNTIHVRIDRYHPILLACDSPDFSGKAISDTGSVTKTAQETKRSRARSAVKRWAASVRRSCSEASLP
jgi:hypothetical protein